MILPQAQDERTFVARLTAKAGALAQARGEDILRERKRDSDRWRAARLLWPLFTMKG